MTRTRSLTASLLTLPAAALLALAGAGTANAAPPSSDEKSRPSVASMSVDSTGAAEFWTADRMRAAVPGDVLAGNTVQRRITPGAAADTAKKVRPNAAREANGSPDVARESAPVEHIGKVFFTMGGANYVCSGNAVSSANESTVATAGHCLNQGPGAYATNFIFVPGYDKGKEPYGRWTAKGLYTTPQWEKEGNIAFDTGFAVMNLNADGETLADVVGSSDVAFGVPRGVQYNSYGYPASTPYDGEHLWNCAGTATDDNTNPQFATQGIPCTMTGGASGGPWLLKNGVQNSVNSYGYSGSGVMYGPYWGAEIEEVYDLAETR